MGARAAQAPTSANSSRSRQECRQPFPLDTLCGTYAPWKIPIPGFPRVLSILSFTFFRPKTTGEKRVNTIAYALGIKKRSKVQNFAYAVLCPKMLVLSEILLLKISISFTKIFVYDMKVDSFLFRNKQGAELISPL